MAALGAANSRQATRSRVRRIMYNDSMSRILRNILVPENELSFSFMRSPGPGGQNVNKVASAVMLRFDVHHSSLPENIRARLLIIGKNKINSHGILIIKATNHRTQESNKREAIMRFNDLLTKASVIPKKRKKTRPTKAAKERRLTQKKLLGTKKSLRSHMSKS